MESVRGPVSAGVGVTAFLATTVVVTEALIPYIAFSLVVGLPIGLIVGVGAAVATFHRFDGGGDEFRWSATSMAAMGYTFLGLFVVRYIGVGRELLTLHVTVITSVLAAILVYAGFHLKKWL